MLELRIRTAYFNLAAGSNDIVKFSVANCSPECALDHVEFEWSKRYRPARGRMRSPVRLNYEFAGCVRIDYRKLIIVRHPAISTRDDRCGIRSNNTILPVSGSGYDGRLLSFKGIGGPVRSSVVDRGRATSGSLG